MATVTFIPNKAQSTSAMKGVLQYIAQEKKTENGSFVSGLNCSPQFCFQEFTATRKLHHKTSKGICGESMAGKRSGGCDPCRR